MAKTWFPHEDGLAEGEESKPLFGPRFGWFWWVGMAVTWGFVLMALYISVRFIFSHTATN